MNIKLKIVPKIVIARLPIDLMFASLVGEGYEKPDQELPLDINYAKITDWLVDRRLLPQDWSRKLQLVESKAAQSAAELPPGFLSNLSGGEEVPLDYFRAHEVLEKLTETAERGLLGTLKGSAGTWERIVKAYEANLLHVAEGGMTLARNVDYEIPYYKKQGAKNQQLISDCEKRASDALKSANVAATAFRKECIAMGITENVARDGARLPSALSSLTVDLPQLMGKAVEATRSAEVREAAEYYAKFTAAVMPDDSLAATLETLTEVREGRTQFEKGQSAASMNATSAVVAGDYAIASGSEPPHVDVAAIEGGIGLQDDSSKGDDPTQQSGAISWDIEIEPETAVEVETACTGTDSSTAIHWDIDISSIGEEKDVLNGASMPSECQNGVQSSAEAMTDASPEAQRLVADNKYRARLLDDLNELRAFLAQRSLEMASKGHEVGIYTSFAAEMASMDQPAVSKLLTAVDMALTAFAEPRLVQLLSLAYSSSYRDRVVEKLLRQAGQENKFQQAARDAQARKASAQRQLVSDSTKLSALVQRTRKIKERIEMALKEKLNRPVNVQGEINAALIM